MLLLAIWLIATGALAFVHVSFANTGLILSGTGPRGGYLPVARSVVDYN